MKIVRYEVDRYKGWWHRWFSFSLKPKTKTAYLRDVYDVTGFYDYSYPVEKIEIDLNKINVAL